MNDRLHDVLESRILFATTQQTNVADYFPLNVGQTSTYNANNGAQNSPVQYPASVITTSSDQVRGIDSTDFAWRGSAAGTDIAIDNAYSLSDTNGLELREQRTAVDPAVTLTVRPTIDTAKSVINEIPLSFGTGQVGSWSSVPIDGTIDVDFGTFGKSGVHVTGTDTGSTTVNGFASVRLANLWTATQALHITIEHQRTLTATIANQNFTYTDTLTEERWLAKGIGIVQEKLTLSGNFQLGTDPQISTSAPAVTIVLKKSSLFSSAVSIADKVLHLNGTTGDDTLIASADAQGKHINFNDTTRDLASSTYARVFARGFGGNDVIEGADGADTLAGDSGDDTLRGHDGNDRLEGGAGNDRILGGNGNDFVKGGTGFDKIYGEAGNDTIRGEAGADIIDGGSGTDRATDDVLDTRRSIEQLMD